MFGDVLEHLRNLTDEELETRFGEVDAVARAALVELSAITDLLAARGVHRAGGHRTINGYLRARHNWSDRDIARHRRIGSLVCAEPVRVGESLVSGRLRPGQVDALARVHANRRVHDQLPDVLDELLDHAHESVRDFDTTVRTWEQLADEDGAFREVQRCHENRNANVMNLGGELHLQATGGELDAIELCEIFEQFVHAEFLADAADARAKYGSDVSPQLFARTAAQRRFDAMVQIFRQAAAAGALNGAIRAPIINLMIDPASFTNALAVIYGTPPLVPPPSLNERVSRTLDGTPVHPMNVVLSALIGQVRRVVTDPNGVVLNLGRRQRLFTGAVRDAVELSSPHCIWPGCTIRAGDCQADHDQPWSKGGSTDARNGRVLCRHHNQFRTDRIRVHRDQHGRWRTTAPDGTDLNPPPTTG